MYHKYAVGDMYHENVATSYPGFLWSVIFRELLPQWTNTITFLGKNSDKYRLRNINSCMLKGYNITAVSPSQALGEHQS